MRLIDADELKKEFDIIVSKSATGEWQTIPIKHIKQITDNAPTVEANSIIDGLNNEIDDLSENLAWYINERNRLLKERRPQGEWITHITYFECSNCKHCCEYDYAEDIDPVTDLNFKFCPNCGAQMKKGGVE